MTNEEFKRRQKKIEAPEIRNSKPTKPVKTNNWHAHLTFIGIMGLPFSILAFISIFIFSSTPWIPATTCLITSILLLIRYKTTTEENPSLFLPLLWFASCILWLIRYLK